METSFRLFGVTIIVSSPPNDHQENDLEKTLSLPLTITPRDEPNPKRKSRVSDEPDKNQKKIRREISQPQPPRDLSSEFLQIIETALPEFLYRKRLTLSDVDRGQNRLLVTEREKLMQFLTPDEEREINSVKNSSIEVKAVDCMGTKFDLRLSTWCCGGEATTSNNTGERKRAKKEKSIVFNQEWCNMLEANEVKPLDIAGLWGFRKEGKFWVAVNFIHP